MMNTQELKPNGFSHARAEAARYLRAVPRIDSMFDQDHEKIERRQQPSMEEIVRSVIDQLIASGVFPQLASSGKDAASTEQKAPRVMPADLGLTRRETEVLRILAQGKSNKEICRELNIAIGTAKIHTRSVCAKLNVTRRAEAVAAVNRMGLVLEAE
ncbi:MAG TPA: LuxR C-terminal-related transcriptional regulator [Burkholderiales bacterium]|nr:LuxR C-terminal-related transcriptional regulator [Burkholderiales bacterium]